MLHIVKFVQTRTFSDVYLEVLWQISRCKIYISVCLELNQCSGLPHLTVSIYIYKCSLTSFRCQEINRIRRWTIVYIIISTNSHNISWERSKNIHKCFSNISRNYYFPRMLFCFFNSPSLNLLKIKHIFLKKLTLLLILKYITLNLSVRKISNSKNKTSRQLSNKDDRDIPSVIK